MILFPLERLSCLEPGSRIKNLSDQSRDPDITVYVPQGNDSDDTRGSRPTFPSVRAPLALSPT